MHHRHTQILHGGPSIDPYTGALSTPIYPASTYHQPSVGTPQAFEYSRSGNPTRQALELTLAALEGVPYGYAFASGVAAISGTFLALLSQGDHLIATQDVYGGTYRLLTQYLPRFGITHTFVDATDLDAVTRAITPQTKAIYIESPSNPLLRILDIKELASLAHQHGLMCFMDNTFLSPYLCRPLDLGVDVSIHSASKYLGGHSDLIAGAVMVKDAQLASRLYDIQNAMGMMLSPENSWLLLRGIKTLGVRLDAQCQTAMQLAQWLQTQSWVRHVYYPGLHTHPGHDLMTQQANGYGAIVSFEVMDDATVSRLLHHTHLWRIAISLGGVESILSYPWTMSHAAIPEVTRTQLGINNRLIRASVGLENGQDLIQDLAQCHPDTKG